MWTDNHRFWMSRQWTHPCLTLVLPTILQASGRSNHIPVVCFYVPRTWHYASTQNESDDITVRSAAWKVTASLPSATRWIPNQMAFLYVQLPAPSLQGQQVGQKQIRRLCSFAFILFSTGERNPSLKGGAADTCRRIAGNISNLLKRKCKFRLSQDTK